MFVPSRPVTTSLTLVQNALTNLQSKTRKQSDRTYSSRVNQRKFFCLDVLSLGGKLSEAHTVIVLSVQLSEVCGILGHYIIKGFTNRTLPLT